MMRRDKKRISTCIIQACVPRSRSLFLSRTPVKYGGFFASILIYNLRERAKRARNLWRFKNCITDASRTIGSNDMRRAAAL